MSAFTTRAWVTRTAACVAGLLALTLAPAAALADAGALGAVTWELRASGGPTADSDFATAYDASRGVVVLFGGAVAGTDTPTDATWLWDGAIWQRAASPGGAPAPRSGHAMAFDAARGKVILFGGKRCDLCAPLADTWEWDGAAWREAGTGPPARTVTAMVFDPRRGKTVLFGGLGAGDPDAGTVGPLADTWELDAAGWRVATPPTSPPARAAAAAAYDTNLRAVVVHGGYARLLPPRNSTVYGDTWAYDGATWRAVDAVGVPEGPLGHRFAATLVHDTARRRSVMVGGFPYVGTFANNETWEHDGTSWLLRGPSGQYPARWFVGAGAFDAARGSVVYVVRAQTGLETWEYHGVAEPCGADTDCDTGHCNGGICCAEACGVCSDCAFTGLACVPVAQRDDRESCTGAMTCDALARCANKLGQACAAGPECASGVCTGGACCLVDACGAYGCGLDGLCRTSCTVASDCAASATCAGGVCSPRAGVCDGDVAVAATGARTACAPFGCGPQGCLATCGTSDDCASGYLCGAGSACVTGARGAPTGCATGGTGDGALAGLCVVGALAAAAGARRRRRAG